MLQTSSDESSSTSRIVTMARYFAGRSSSAAVRARAASPRENSSSGVLAAHARGGSAHIPLPSKRPSTGEPSSSCAASPPTAEKGSDRPSLTARVLARLTTMRSSHVLIDERPSNCRMPFIAASQVSWATSCADALVVANIAARRTSEPWCRSTSSANAVPSPVRTRSSIADSCAARSSNGLELLGGKNGSLTTVPK